jgi:hypothetical protein
MTEQQDISPQQSEKLCEKINELKNNIIIRCFPLLSSVFPFLREENRYRDKKSTYFLLFCVVYSIFRPICSFILIIKSNQNVSQPTMIALYFNQFFLDILKVVMAINQKI